MGRFPVTVESVWTTGNVSSCSDSPLEGTFSRSALSIRADVDWIYVGLQLGALGESGCHVVRGEVLINENEDGLSDDEADMTKLQLNV